jgi:hypothetical protein
MFGDETMAHVFLHRCAITASGNKSVSQPTAGAPE